MSTDLRHALHTLHDGARRDAGELPTAPLVSRARRRRTLVRTGYGAVGAGAAAALAVGGVALSGRLGRPAPIATDPAPVVTPTPTPAPTRSTGPSPSATPNADAPFQPDLAVCGTTLDTSGDLAISTDDMWQSKAGEPLAAGFDAGGIGKPGDRATLTHLASVLTSVAEGEDPVVIGVAAQELPPPAARVLEDPLFDGPDGTGHTGVALKSAYVMCPGVDGAGETPPDGEYLLWNHVSLTVGDTTRSGWAAVYAVVGAMPDGTGAEDGANPGGTPQGLAPVILPEGTTRTVTSDGGTDQTSCGSEASSISLAGSRPTQADWTATSGAITATASTRIENERLVVGLHLVNGGAALTNVTVRYPTFYATSDAATPPVIGAAGNVGSGYSPTSAPGSTMGPAPVRWTTVSSWPAGGAVDLELDAGPYTCTFAPGGGTRWAWMTASWPVFASTEVTVGGTTTPVRAPATTLTVTPTSAPPTGQ